MKLSSVASSVSSTTELGPATISLGIASISPSSGSDTTMRGTESVGTKGLMESLECGGVPPGNAEARSAEVEGWGAVESGDGSRLEGGTLPEGGRESKLASAEGLLDPSPPAAELAWSCDR